MVLTYRKAAKSDASLLIDIYNSSFYDDYVHYGECPGYGKTKSQMELSILKFPKYIIIKDNIPVGVISFENKGNGHYCHASNYSSHLRQLYRRLNSASPIY
ncbi:MAG: hypothetical protein K2N15_06050, partial [Lachnospiraceae bacterium]|nr:hypothetical protein [Lachnospiraceae bacterium]